LFIGASATLSHTDHDNTYFTLSRAVPSIFNKIKVFGQKNYRFKALLRVTNFVDYSYVSSKALDLPPLVF
jgi:hypothetical protein